MPGTMDLVPMRSDLTEYTDVPSVVVGLASNSAFDRQWGSVNASLSSTGAFRDPDADEMRLCSLW